jgi:hypothetical protein
LKAGDFDPHGYEHPRGGPLWAVAVGLTVSLAVD